MDIIVELNHDHVVTIFKLDDGLTTHGEAISYRKSWVAYFDAILERENRLRGCIELLFSAVSQQ